MQDIIDRHYAWLVSMGYNTSSPLEALALITSEIGEAVNECRGINGAIENKHALGEELADIILRVIGMAKQHDIAIEEHIRIKIKKNEQKGNKGRLI